MKERRKPEYPEKTPGDELQKSCHSNTINYNSEERTNKQASKQTGKG